MRPEFDTLDYAKRYSHESEDLILRMLLPYKQGTYIETGMWEPISMSNSYVFYEMGWSGLLIEPHPAWYRKVKSTRPRDITIHSAVGEIEGTVQLNVASAASSILTEWSMTPTHAIDVPIQRLSKILEAYPQFNRPDFFSLDVEGWELQALNGVDWNLFRPTVICIESVEWNPFKRVHNKWEHILLSQGYKLICHNMQNRFYGVIEDEHLWKQVAKYSLGE